MTIRPRALLQLRWLSAACASALLAGWVNPVHVEAQDSGEPVTAKITIGSHEGTAHPTRHGHAITGGGTISVEQPAPDTVVVTMTGNAAAGSNAFMSAEAAVDFVEQLQFQVCYSEPGHVGNMVIQARVNGLLRSQGKHAVVGMSGATATVTCGEHVLASVPLAQRMLGGCDSLAVNAAHGPICVPVGAGCYSLQQHFRIMASQQPGGFGCHKASAEFSSSQLPGTWTGQSYPFKDIDKSNLGFQVTLRVVPSATGRIATTAMPNNAPATAQYGQQNNPIFPSPPINVARMPGQP
jgi:hypothetical protein